jgi:hypothetical protein
MNSTEKFLKLAKEHPNKLIPEASELIVDAFKLMRNVIQAITESKPDTTQNLAVVITPYVKELDTKIGKKMKDINVKNHCRALLDGLQLVQLVIMDDPFDMGKEYLGQIDFYGNKVVQLKKEPDTEW